MAAFLSQLLQRFLPGSGAPALSEQTRANPESTNGQPEFDAAVANLPAADSQSLEDAFSIAGLAGLPEPLELLERHDRLQAQADEAARERFERDATNVDDLVSRTQARIGDLDSRLQAVREEREQLTAAGEELAKRESNVAATAAAVASELAAKRSLYPARLHVERQKALDGAVSETILRIHQELEARKELGDLETAALGEPGLLAGEELKRRLGSLQERARELEGEIDDAVRLVAFLGRRGATPAACRSLAWGGAAAALAAGAVVAVSALPPVQFDGFSEMAATIATCGIGFVLALAAISVGSLLTTFLIHALLKRQGGSDVARPAFGAEKIAAYAAPAILPLAAYAAFGSSPGHGGGWLLSLFLLIGLSSIACGAGVVGGGILKSPGRLTNARRGVQADIDDVLQKMGAGRGVEARLARDLDKARESVEQDWRELDPLRLPAAAFPFLRPTRRFWQTPSANQTIDKATLEEYSPVDTLLEPDLLARLFDSRASLEEIRAEAERLGSREQQARDKEADLIARLHVEETRLRELRSAHQQFHRDYAEQTRQEGERQMRHRLAAAAAYRFGQDLREGAAVNAEAPAQEKR